jgi:peptidyl-prolyl cis-trans isomerase C
LTQTLGCAVVGGIEQPPFVTKFTTLCESSEQAPRSFNQKPPTAVLFLVLLLIAAGCGEQKPPPSPPPAPEGEIARVGDVSISKDTFETLLNMRARGAPERYATMPAKEALLDELVRREALFAKARAAGFDQRPDIQESVKRLIASKFLEEQTKQQPTFDPSPSKKEIEQYYQQHTDQFASPAKARGAVLFVKISPLADPDKREQLMAKAQSLLDQAKAEAPGDFGRLVAANSEDQATRYQGGDLGWVIREAKSSPLDPAVTEALFALKNPGDFAPLVPARRGVYIVKLLEFQPAGARPLKEVRDAIGYLLRKQKQEQHEQDFYAAMKAGLDIRINRPLLESIQPPPPPDKTPPATPGSVAQLK